MHIIEGIKPEDLTYDYCSVVTLLRGDLATGHKLARTYGITD